MADDASDASADRDDRRKPSTGSASPASHNADSDDDEDLNDYNEYDESEREINEGSGEDEDTAGLSRTRRDLSTAATPGLYGEDDELRADGTANYTNNLNFHTSFPPDWTFPRFKGDTLPNDPRGSGEDLTSDFGRVGALSFGFPGLGRVSGLGGLGDEPGYASLLTDPPLVLPIGSARRFRPQLGDSDSFEPETERQVADMLRLPAVKMLPRKRVVYPTLTKLDNITLSSMVHFRESHDRASYFPRDLVSSLTREAFTADALTRRYDPSLGPLLDVTQNIQLGVLDAGEEMEDEDEERRRAETPALSHVPDVTEWQAWNWAAYASGEGFGDLYLSPFFMGTSTQFETRIIPVPYLKTGSHVRQVAWTAFPNQSPRILYRDGSSINFLSDLVFAPDSTVLAKLFNQSHHSYRDRLDRLTARPPFRKPLISTWKFEGDLPMDCDWNRWISGEVVAVTEAGKVIYRDMEASTDKASLVGSFSETTKDGWLAVKYAPDHPRIVGVSSSRQLGWADIRTPDLFRHNLVYQSPSTDLIRSFTHTKKGLSVVATDKMVLLFDRRMPGRELVSWAHHSGNNVSTGSFVELEVVDVPVVGGQAEAWIVASSRHEPSSLVIPINTSTTHGRSPHLSSAPFSVAGAPNVIDPVRESLPAHTLRPNAKREPIDRTKLVLGTRARYFARGPGASDEVAFGDRLVVWQLSEDGSVWCSGAAFGASSQIWDSPKDHARTESEYLLEEEAGMLQKAAADAVVQKRMQGNKLLDLSGLLKFSLRSISTSHVGAVDADQDAIGGLDVGPADRPYTLWQLQGRKPPAYAEDGTFLSPGTTSLSINQRDEYALPTPNHRLWTPDKPSWLGGIDLEHPYTVWEDLANLHLYPGVNEIDATTVAETADGTMIPDRSLEFARALRSESVNRLAGELFLGGTAVFPPMGSVHDEDVEEEEDEEAFFSTPVLSEPVQLSAAAKFLKGQWTRPRKHKYRPIKVDARTKKLQMAAKAAEDDSEESESEEETGSERGSRRAPSVRAGSQRPGSQRPGSQRPGSQLARAGTVDSVRSGSVPRASQTPAPNQRASQTPQPGLNELIDSYLVGTQASQPTQSQTQASQRPNKKPRRSGF